MTTDQAEPAEAPKPQMPRADRREPRETIVIDASAVADPAGQAPAEAAASPAEPDLEPNEPEPGKKSRKGMIAALIAVLVAGGVWAAWQSPDIQALIADYLPGASAPTAPASPPAVAKAPASAPAPVQQAVPPIRPAPAADLAKAPAPSVAAPATASPDALAALEKKLEQRLAAIEAQAQARPAAPASAPANLKPLEDRLAAIEKRLQPLEALLSAPKSEVRATEAPASTAPRRPDSAALAVIAQTIAQAIDRGAPFPAALGAAQALGASPDALAPLRAVAEKGAPTARALADQFAGVAKAALAAAEPPLAADASLRDRLGAMASRLVRVRPASEAKGNDAPSVVSRIEAALARGSVSDALAAWNQLPQSAKDASRGFADSARQRANAEAAAAALLDKSIEELASVKDKP